MRSPITLAAALAAVLFAGGCVSVGPTDGRPPAHPAPAAVRAASPDLAKPTQASGRTAFVETAQDAAPMRRPAKRRTAGSRHDNEAVPAPRRPVPRSTARGPRQAVRRPRQPWHLSAPRHRARPRPAATRRAPHRRARSQAQPGPTYDLRTVCGWSDGVVAPSVRSLCDTYAR